IIGPEFYILSRQEQEPPRAPPGLASTRGGVEGGIPGWGGARSDCRPERTSRAPTLGSYCLIPSSPRASFASVTESACLPSLCSASPLPSLDAAFFTLSLLASIFASASCPCLMSAGHWNAIAVPAVDARPPATAVAPSSGCSR